MILDKLNNPNLTNQSQHWKFITDQVMGGISTGKVNVENINGIKCYRMTGNVSTKNNGGFIQIRTKLFPEIDTKDYEGIYIKVYGNDKNYNLHLRTGLTLAPWQYYSYTFFSKKIGMKLEHHLISSKNQIFINPKAY